MKFFSVIATLMFSFNLLAVESKIAPIVGEALELYLDDQEADYILRPELHNALQIIKSKEIDRAYVQKLLSKKNFAVVELPEKDQFDLLIEQRAANQNEKSEVPAVSLHAFKLDIKRQSDLLSDDVYAYFFVTDGVVPTGKVTNVYKDTRSGQSFHFNEVDRAIFPLVGIPAKVPQGHLIVDYGIIESDGDDIKQMQRLSSIIIDLAITIYSTQNPEAGAVLNQMRREIKALADMLLELNHDDRLFTGSFAYRNAEIAEHLKDTTYIEFSKNHKNPASLGGFDYTLNFRLLR